MISVFENVYEPSDDTWLLIEALNEAKASGRIGVDLGSGTGIVGLVMLKNTAVNTSIFIDVNPYAALNTMYNLYLNKLDHRGLVIQGSVDILQLKRGIADIVVANPPYLPGERTEDLIDHALIAGPEGFEAIKEFIEFSNRILKKNGLLFLVYSSLSNQDAIKNLMMKNCFRTLKMWVKHVFFEDIFVVEAVKECM